MNKAKKPFDWNMAQIMHSPEVYEFMLAVHDKPISEEEFAQKYSALPREGRLHASGTRSPSKAKKKYRHLKEVFGFFS